jgi:hypothetical protein
MQIKVKNEKIPQILKQSLSAESSTKEYALGTIVQLINGDKYIYCKAGAVALTAGKLVQSPFITVTNGNISLAVTATAVGANVITATLGSAVALAANELENGTIYVNDAAGEGQVFEIYSHPAAAVSTACAITIYDSVATALTTSSKVTLVPNRCAGLIVHPSPPTAEIICVPVRDVTANYYFWGKTEGIASVLIDGTVTVGKVCVASDATDGAAEVFVANNYQSVGLVIVANATTEYGLVDLML